MNGSRRDDATLFHYLIILFDEYLVMYGGPLEQNYARIKELARFSIACNKVEVVSNCIVGGRLTSSYEHHVPPALDCLLS